MPEPIKPGLVQRRIIQIVNYEDGLWDITLGLIFLALGIFPLTRKLLGPELNFGLYLAFLAAIVIVLQYARRIISTPRIGIVKGQRSKAKMVVVAVLILLVLLTLALVIVTLTSKQSTQQSSEATPTPAGMDYTVDAIAGVAVAGIFSLMRFVFGIRRLHLYGALIGGGNLASTFLRYEFGYAFNLPLVVAAGVIILIGMILLFRFIRKYPIPSGEVVHGDQ